MENLPAKLTGCADPEHKKLRDDFDTHVTNRLGVAATIKYFDTFDLAPESVYYEYTYSTIHKGSPDEVLTTTWPWYNYINVKIMLPRGDKMATGLVSKRDSDLDSNPLGTANDNPIIGTHQYIVEFSDRYEAELAANVIASNIYAQCYPDGNQ